MIVSRCRALSVILGLSLIVLGARAIWRISETETGWQPIADQWRASGAALLGRDTLQLSDREPREQALYWLDEWRRIRAQSDSPGIAEGAGWVLDAPCFAFASRLGRRKPRAAGLSQILAEARDLPLALLIEPDYDAIARAEAEFESLCRDECRVASEWATQADPANLDRWRARAWLLFKTSHGSLDIEPRLDDWLAVLNECARHDPENALYDYLAALRLWTESAEQDYSHLDGTLTVTDRHKFEQAQSHFHAGQARIRMLLGTDGYAETLRFLDQTSLSRLERLKVAEERTCGHRPSGSMLLLLRWQLWLSGYHQANGDLSAALATTEDMLQVANQIERSANTPDTVQACRIIRRFTLSRRKELASASPKLLSVNEAEADKRQRADVGLELAIFDAASVRLRQTSDRFRTAALGAQVRVELAQASALFLAGIAVLFGLPGWILDRRRLHPSIRLRWWRHTLAWGAGLGGSFLLFGLCPSGVIPPEAQTSVVRGGVWLAAALICAVPLWLIHRFGGVCWSELLGVAGACVVIASICLGRDMMHSWGIQLFTAWELAPLLILIGLTIYVGWRIIALTAEFVRSRTVSWRVKAYVSAVLLLLAMCIFTGADRLEQMLEEQIPIRIWIPAVGEFAAPNVPFLIGELNRVFRGVGGTWFSAIGQWVGFRGPVSALMCTLLILSGWTILRSRRQHGVSLRELLGSRPKRVIIQASRVIAASAAVPAVACLLASLAWTPSATDAIEQVYRYRMNRLRNPAAVWRQVDESIAAVKANTALMARLRAEAGKE